MLDAATGDDEWTFRVDGFDPYDQGTFELGGTPALVVALEDSGIEAGGISDPDLPGVFVKFSGSPPTGQILDTSPGNPGDPGGHAHIDATPCLALDAEGKLLRVFETMEVGRGIGVDPDGSLLWSFGPSDTLSETLRRTDLISVAMGRDGTIYVGTRGAYGVRYPPYGQVRPGWVYALWGFEQ